MRVWIPICGFCLTGKGVAIRADTVAHKGGDMIELCMACTRKFLEVGGWTIEPLEFDGDYKFEDYDDVKVQIYDLD